MDNSINIEARLFKFCVINFDVIMEDTMPQIHLLGPSSFLLYVVMKIFHTIYKKYHLMIFFINCMKYFAIFVIKSKPRHK